MLLNLALIQCALAHAVQRGCSPVMTPFFMRQDAMAECAQLGDFDEQLYKVSGDPGMLLHSLYGSRGPCTLHGLESCPGACSSTISLPGLKGLCDSGHWVTLEDLAPLEEPVVCWLAAGHAGTQHVPCWSSAHMWVQWHTSI